jgi:hypothetical protein
MQRTILEYPSINTKASSMLKRLVVSKEDGGYLLSHTLRAVPSAMGGLTSLFGMGRGEHPRQNHHNKL